MATVTRTRRRFRLPHRFALEYNRTRYVVWLGVPFVKLLTGHQAITIYDVVFIAPHQWSPEAHAHEFAHVMQWRRYGVVGFLSRYVRESRRHGYALNGFEELARQFAAKYGRTFRPLSLSS